ncbi:MlaD family protein [Nocardia sp. CA-136227]|uniref:MlaD family protein n=1 Tax=Nocardia sp. CA-136227 TaxID=3239979 RepID=UPI003D95D8CE
MPAYGLPGVTTTPGRARRSGLLAAALAATVLIGWQAVPKRADPGTVTVDLVTARVGTGIEPGSPVRADGVQVGEVRALAQDGLGRQRITLRLSESQLRGLTDALSLDYAPGNLFGISEIELHPGAGGRPLREVAQVDLTGDNGARTNDATLSTLLRSLGQLTGEVLTPQLISVLRQISDDTRAFAPLFQAIVSMVQSVADTQQLPPSLLLNRYGSALAGLPPTLTGLLDVLNGAFSNQYLGQDGKIAKFDANVNMIKDDLLGALVRVLNAGDAHYSGLTAALTPILSGLAATVPDPAAAGADLTLLLQRLRAALPDTPGGPVLNLAVDLRGVPGLAIPLVAALAPPTAASVPQLPGGAR